MLMLIRTKLLLVLLANCLFVGAVMAQTIHPWQIYINTGEVIYFQVSHIKQNGIVNEKRSGISFNVIDSLVIQDSSQVAELDAYFDDIQVVWAPDGFHVNLSRASREIVPPAVPEPLMEQSRTQLTVGSRPGIQLDYKINPESFVIMRVDGGLYTARTLETMPLAIDIGIGGGFERWQGRFGLSLVSGLMIYYQEDSQKAMYGAGIAPAVFVNPALTVTLGALGNKHLVVGLKAVAVGHYVEPQFQIGLGWYGDWGKPMSGAN